MLTVSDNQRDATELQDGLLLVSDADVELLNRKGVDLLAAFRCRDGALKNVPSLHVLATMAKKGGWATTEELLRNVQKFLDDAVLRIAGSGGKAAAIESAQKDIRGTLKDLDLIRDSNEALAKVEGKRPTFREAFVDYWNHITAGGAEHDVLRFSQILQAVANSGPFVDGGDPRELARKTVSLIYSQVFKAVNDVEDLTYEVIRSTIRHVFTDAAAKFLGLPDYSRTKASDVLMTLWSMTDQALAVLMNAYPEPEKTQKREQTEKDFFDRRVTQLEANPEDRALLERSRALLERSRALLERDRLQTLRTRADVGTWPEVGDRVFLRVDATSEDQTQKVSPFKANLLLGSKDNVQDVRVKDDVILFKPKGENEPGDWSLGPGAAFPSRFWDSIGEASP